VTALPPRMQDLALALALAAYNVGSLIPETRELPLPYAAYAAVILQALPLTWRRRWPVAVFFAVGIPRDFYDLFIGNFAPLPLAPAIAYYTVMDRSSTRARWIVSAVLLTGIIRSQMLPGHTEPYDFFVDLLQFVVAGMAGIVTRTRRAYVAEVEARAEQAEAERDRQAAMAAAQERTRIARELHDVVAHHVSLMAVQSEAAASLLPDRPEAAGKSVEIIGQTAREALTELRRLLGVLRGPSDRRQAATSPSPSISELDEVLLQVRQAGIAVDLRVEGSPNKLAPGVDLTAYRIVQEALTNTVRHSGASQAAVIVSYEPGYVTVSVTDAGRGPVAVTVGRPADQAGHAPPDPPDPPDPLEPLEPRDPLDPPKTNGTRLSGPGGFGLAGIAERVASCGGSLTVGPSQAGGFAVTARLPTP